ncbi:uncharacterized protein PGTG_18705 [Puccinia graminis f. sp. tritici CRL 75-36-700-3]|uniref:DUF6589 domain-containing protein n=1 Tax=Puccinia graminis f. sp. tritici (strain CRL 75-36-700-3 / race SCCL) TaxID=418459 RepID=E3L7P8_PUCGT|nr:uncharacterized protein PGTG_18705 [Puccinia graminis f. sp. tritici CRL 75-36-700-3]EFP92573.2 hypothetical protein PGTG_18705 [Puccinia graminis f. sp. tritici CRL 75-36-700-3]
MDLVVALRNEVNRTNVGRKAWSQFILHEAILIASTQVPPRGNYPDGRFHSSATVTKSFFTPHEMEVHDKNLTEHNMPFIYNLLLATLNRAGVDDPVHLEEVTTPGPAGVVDNLTPEGLDGISYAQESDGIKRAQRRGRRLATTICAMMAYSQNRRNNAFQLHNSVRFYACGVSDRVHEYLNYIGLASLRSTALSALKTLSQEGEKEIRKAMRIAGGMPISPTICIDNIDIEQHVHQLTVGNRSHMFRGTWGYIHLPNKQLVANLDPSELSLETFLKAMHTVERLEIQPHMFLPSPSEQLHEKNVIKSQIAKVLYDYLAVPNGKSTSISTDPPPLDPISPEKPDLLMLKLMDASDNSAEGIGQVFESIIGQTGMSSKDFFARLQPMDGDLGTVQNFNCLRAQRFPSAVPQNRLDNIFFQLGASHTLWNIGSNIFTHHFGNPKDTDNCGAWQHLEALGFPSEKAIQKKDFSLMINQMERVYEAIVYYCLRVVMKNNNHNLTSDKLRIPTGQWEGIVNECYDRFLSPQARSAAAAKGPSHHKLSNTLVQLHDFSTVVEAKRAMKARDIGRLSKYLKHNLLISPSGRPGHFVAKDYWLEIQNYWIKFLYNNNGTGTQLDRLRNVFLLNIFLSMFQSLKNDCGAKVIHQSHKNSLPTRSLEMFTMLGNNRDILTIYSANKIGEVDKVDDTYKSGIQKLKKMICTDKDLKRFKKHIYYQLKPRANSKSKNVTIGELPDASDAGDSQSEDM